MTISAEAAMLLPLFIGVGAFAGGQAYEAVRAIRLARWRSRHR